MSEYDKYFRKLEELGFIELEGDKVRLTDLTPKLFQKYRPLIAQILISSHLQRRIKDPKHVIFTIAGALIYARIRELGEPEVDGKILPDGIDTDMLVSVFAVILDRLGGEEGRKAAELIYRIGNTLIENVANAILEELEGEN